MHQRRRFFQKKYGKETIKSKSFKSKLSILNPCYNIGNKEIMTNYRIIPMKFLKIQIKNNKIRCKMYKYQKFAQKVMLNVNIMIKRIKELQIK